MLIGVPREMLYGETRVAATPKTVEQIKKLGFDVLIEQDAGFKASFEDSAFANAGAKIGSQEEVWNADIIFKVNAPTEIIKGIKNTLTHDCHRFPLIISKH